MLFEQNGTRIETLAGTMQEITAIYDLANPKGIRAVKFFNAKQGLMDVKNKDWRSHFDRIKYDGVTRIGIALKTKILEHFVWKTVMTKPLLVMIMTDGDVGSQTALEYLLEPQLTIRSIKGGGRAERDVGRCDSGVCCALTRRR